MVLRYDAVYQVEALLKRKKHSFREIASRTGVSRAKVSEIAKGQRKVTSRPAGDPQARPAWRCPKCGGKITTESCLRCLAEAEKEKGRPAAA
jgi:DNA-directed RNA polymerase subunit RPC12/RpoP